MDKETADSIVEALAWMEVPLGKLAGHIQEGNMTEDERTKMKKAVSEMFSGNFTLHMMILNRFPEFDSDNAGKEDYNSRIKKYCTEEITFDKLRPNE